MDIDNIIDIEVLRGLAKESRAKVKRNMVKDDGFVFKAGEYYPCSQNRECVALYSDDHKHCAYLTYKEAEDLLY